MREQLSSTSRSNLLVAAYDGTQIVGGVMSAGSWPFVDQTPIRKSPHANELGTGVGNGGQALASDFAGIGKVERTDRVGVFRREHGGHPGVGHGAGRHARLGQAD